MQIEPGSIVVMVMREPREKLIGVLYEIDDAGIHLRALDLNYFDEWTNAIKNGETYLPMQDIFVPMWRIERVSRDEDSAGVPSLARVFHQRTGLDLTEV